MDGAKGVELCGSAPKAHLVLGGDEHVLRARHERRLELGPELGLDLAAHRAAWRLCGLEALGVRDEREQEHGGAEHRACLEYWKRGSYISGPSCAGRVKRADTRLGGLPPVFL